MQTVHKDESIDDERVAAWSTVEKFEYWNIWVNGRQPWAQEATYVVDLKAVGTNQRPLNHQPAPVEANQRPLSHQPAAAEANEIHPNQSTGYTRRHRRSSGDAVRAVSARSAPAKTADNTHHHPLTTKYADHARETKRDINKPPSDSATDRESRAAEFRMKLKAYKGALENRSRLLRTSTWRRLAGLTHLPSFQTSARRFVWEARHSCSERPSFLFFLGVDQLSGPFDVGTRSAQLDEVSLIELDGAEQFVTKGHEPHKTVAIEISV
ncbi:hypothetical protein NM208_g3247 [Fusarium decemcellulare]|uniref:Uncharacterized protein n=1 Tax=Fusarium decemcellulare TaxID=57161 RepID=A0ACC1SPW3_9HYPO|nr:hypothetical protein NM208_g3247 [Fusarium decemcellulare]